MVNAITETSQKANRVLSQKKSLVLIFWINAIDSKVVETLISLQSSNPIVANFCDCGMGNPES